MAAVKKKERSVHQDLNNFVDFKREMIRLDYAAANLRKVNQQIENEKEKRRETLRQAVRDVELRSRSLERKLLEDDQETLQLEKMARLKSEERRLLEAKVMSVRQKVEDLSRKTTKLRMSVGNLEQHRVFLNDIIAHKVSPRTPSSVRFSVDVAVEIVQNPNMVRERLAQKERNVLSQSELLYQTTVLVTRYPINYQPSSSVSLSEQITSTSAQNSEPKLHFGLSDDVFAVIHRLYKRFISAKSCNYDPLGNFASIERYAYYLLDLVDTCDPSMLKKIISKIVKDKKKLLETQVHEQSEAKRRQREEIALARATSAPAQFQRPAMTRKQTALQRKQASIIKEEIIMKHKEDLSYLFRLQQE